MSFPRYAEYKDSGVEWLGEIPSDWISCQLKRYLTVQSGDMLSITETQESGFPIVGGNGYRGYTSKFNTFRNTIVIGRVGAKCGCVHVIKEDFWASEHAFRVLPRKQYSLKYMAWYLENINLNQYAITTAQPLLNTEIVTSQYLAIPSKTEQTQIAAFLDHETAKLDNLINQQKKLIELLKEKRQAVISHAVTKGLNPNAPMKDSGVEWLGKVPEGWGITPIRNLIRAGSLILQDGNHGELHPTANDYVEEGIPFLMANNVRSGRLLIDDVKKIPKNLADKLRIGFAKAGDMLLTHKGTVGEVALIPQNIQEDYWMLTPQVTYYRWRNKEYLNKYFYYQFQSSLIQSQLEVIGGKQSTRAYVGLIAQGDLVVVIPPLHEQLEIASNIIEKDKNYQQMIEKAESAIQLLQERRTALISAAVTGKIDVREYKSLPASL